MKKLALIILFTITCSSVMGQFFADQSVIIDERLDDDLYAAGETIEISGIIAGDAILGGNTLKINNRVEEDLIAAGGTINVFGTVGDDARLAGGNITVGNLIEDDLVIAGGMVLIEPEALIKGNLIVTGGDITINGNVEGDIKIYGKNIELSGLAGGDVEIKGQVVTLSNKIRGSSEIAAEVLELESGTEFGDNVTYWSRNDDYEIEDFLTRGEAEFDESLEFSTDSSWNIGSGGKIFWWIIQLIMVAILAMVYNTLFPNAFRKSPGVITSEAGRSFGYGMLYMILTPLIGLFLIVIIIGIPVGLSILLLYGLSLLFASSIVSLVIAYYLDGYYERKWTGAQLIGITLMCFVVIKLLGDIPYVGWVFKLLLAVMVFGAFIILIIDRKKTEGLTQTT